MTYSTAAAGGAKTLPSWRMTSVGAWTDVQQRPDVELRVLHPRHHVPSGNTGPLVAGQPAVCFRIVAKRWNPAGPRYDGVKPESIPSPQATRLTSATLLLHLDRHPPRIVLGLQKPHDGVDENERSHSIGVGCGEGDRHRRPVRVRHDRRPSRPDRVEHGDEVAHRLLDPRAQVVARVHATEADPTVPCRVDRRARHERRTPGDGRTARPSGAPRSPRPSGPNLRRARDPPDPHRRSRTRSAHHGSPRTALRESRARREPSAAAERSRAPTET